MTDFATWIVNAHPGGSFVYFVGDLGKERFRDSILKLRNKKLDDANLAWAMAVRRDNKEGKIALVQRVVYPGTFEYIAQKVH